MAKPVSLQRDYERLISELAACQHTLSPRNQHSFGEALADLDRCRRKVIDFKSRYPRLSADKVGTLEGVLTEIDRQKQRVLTLSAAAGYPQKIITIWDLQPGGPKR